MSSVMSPEYISEVLLPVAIKVDATADRVLDPVYRGMTPLEVGRLPYPSFINNGVITDFKYPTSEISFATNKGGYRGCKELEVFAYSWAKSRGWVIESDADWDTMDVFGRQYISTQALHRELFFKHLKGRWAAESGEPDALDEQVLSQKRLDIAVSVDFLCSFADAMFPVRGERWLEIFDLISFSGPEVTTREFAIKGADLLEPVFSKLDGYCFDVYAELLAGMDEVSFAGAARMLAGAVGL